MDLCIFRIDEERIFEEFGSFLDLILVILATILDYLSSIRSTALYSNQMLLRTFKKLRFQPPLQIKVGCSTIFSGSQKWSLFGVV